jgi:RimJ/RimL family protein N-acetyltransferase
MLEIVHPIHTDRLILRPYEPTDLDGIHAMFSLEDVCRYLPWGPMDLEQRFTQTRIDAEGDAVVLAAVEAETGRHVGEFMLRLKDEPNGHGEIGWSLHPDVHGRGLATEGAGAFLRLGFEDLGLHRIEADCDARNLASTRVMDRLGMRREAHFLEYAFVKGEWADEFLYAILASEWRGERDRATSPST